MPLDDMLSSFWRRVQDNLFPWLEEELGPLSDIHKRIVTVLEMVRIEGFTQSWHGLPGRPLAERGPLARAFVAKAVLGLPRTNMLIERLKVDKSLRRLCGWEGISGVPSEATFSRAFAEFAASALPARVHAALIKKTYAGRLVGHISRDATAIEAREKPARSSLAATKPKRKRGRPKKGEAAAPKEPRRLELQAANMPLTQMLADLPRACNVGTKRNAKGHTESWIGDKLPMDVADRDIPVTCILTSASLHDSQAAIPLATITASRVTNFYDLMDSAYDAPEIKAKSLALGHVAIIDSQPRRGGKAEAEREAKARRKAGFKTAEDLRYNERSSAERVNGAAKDSYGARHVRVRGHDKVYCHLMFGILALSVEQIMRLIV